MRKTVIAALTLAIAMGALAGPALAKGPALERGNWLSGVATPVELSPADISLGELADGTEFVTVNHNIAADFGGYDTLVQREPVRYKQNVVTEVPVNFNSAWLGILGPQGPAVPHKGEMTWYYDTADAGWVSLTFKFDGQGNLEHVNGVVPQ
jgi:hypothetical protein